MRRLECVLRDYILSIGFYESSGSDKIIVIPYVPQNICVLTK